MSGMPRAEEQSEGWSPATLMTVATEGSGIDELIDALDAHHAHLSDSGELQERRRARLERHTRDVVDRSLSTLVWQRGHGEQILESGLERVVTGDVSPYRLAQDIVAGALEGGNEIAG